MPEDPLNPEDCLRSLAAEALLRAPHQPLFPESLGLMAVANAFVMLGLLPEQRAARDPAGRPEWFELAPTIGGGSGRVVLPSPAQVPVGRSDPPWPTPAESYLAALAPVTRISMEAGGTVSEAGPEETARIVATVADSLIAVGALPVTSTLLRESPAAARAGTFSWRTGGAAAPTSGPPGSGQRSIADWSCSYRWSTPRLVSIPSPYVLHPSCT